MCTLMHNDHSVSSLFHVPPNFPIPRSRWNHPATHKTTSYLQWSSIPTSDYRKTEHHCRKTSGYVNSNYITTQRLMVYLFCWIQKHFASTSLPSNTNTPIWSMSMDERSSPLPGRQHCIFICWPTDCQQNGNPQASILKYSAAIQVQERFLHII